MFFTKPKGVSMKKLFLVFLVSAFASSLAFAEAIKTMPITAQAADNNSRAMYYLTVDGGSWQSEVTWEITNLVPEILYSGFCPEIDTPVDLPDGTYIFNGYDSYGDGWNGNYATLVDGDGNIQFSETLDSGDFFTFEFTVPSGDVYGCTDPEALNYNPDATIDDGSCLYEAPANDLCENAEYVTLPAAGIGTTQGATPDCVDLLNWYAVWYAFDLPYESNLVVTTLEGVDPDVLSNAGIILMDDCLCDDYVSSYGSYVFEDGVLTCTYADMPAGPWLWPVMAMDVDGLNIDFAYTITVQENILGCTDPDADNYNPDATIDDGSCEYSCDDGCFVYFNLFDSYGDGWNGSSIFFLDDVITCVGSETTVIYCLPGGVYDYYFDAAGGWVYECSWTITDDDGNILDAYGPDLVDPVQSSFTLDCGASEVVPTEYALQNNYPNPFNPTTTIDFSIGDPGHVNLSVYNMAGSLVATLVDGQVEAGSHTAQFDATDLSSGIYFYTMTSGTFVDTKKMVFVK